MALAFGAQFNYPFIFYVVIDYWCSSSTPPTNAAQEHRAEECVAQGIDGSECGRDRPGFGYAAVSQKLRRIQYYIIVNILKMKLCNVL